MSISCKSGGIHSGAIAQDNERRNWDNEAKEIGKWMDVGDAAQLKVTYGL